MVDGRHCPYCGNPEDDLLTYITKDADHTSYRAQQASISIIVCENCERWFRLISDAGQPPTCLRWEEISGLR